MIEWGKKKYKGQTKSIQIGPRQANPPVAKPVMSKAGTPVKPYTPPKSYGAGGRSNVLPNKPATPKPKKVNPKVR